MGSRNWQDSHYGLDREKAFLDQDVEIAGNIAMQMDAYFDRIWGFCRVKDAWVGQRRRWDVWNWGSDTAAVSDESCWGAMTPPAPAMPKWSHAIPGFFRRAGGFDQ